MENKNSEAEAGAEAVEPGYTIDELSALSSVPSRTIRFYQASGALAPPERRGRQAFYGESHLERLKLVAELQDRGLNLKAIRDLLNRADAGELSVREWLGTGEKLRAPWSDDRPRLLGEDELAELVGGTPRPGLLSELVRNGLLRREGDVRPATYLAQSPALVRMAVELDSAGVEPADAARALGILRKRMARAADELVAHFARDAYRRGGSARDYERSLDALRAVGNHAVRLVFAQEMERALGELVDKRPPKPPKRGR